ncbi:DUF2294 domain-containing protein [Chamaesiphon minutus]|uniref:Na+-translocating membrane potential-generating system MpsC domain-containing protein n=1 Tax=Chamaesiphon minutus (strain ATCC 27169 / PCC 6605) TaxID=1173020 RepID=K9ULM2_CHAP6|nr:DUF2294 domain-containing protein [Chamaesiphon minutus]AFY95316.1 hypothetical protein Cha6605_4382 [Chamaesiphon minutus PCC 6605]
MVNAELTVGQLERKLSQKLQALYKEKLGHRPSQITCKLFDQKVVIIIEDSITPTEQLLLATGDNRLAEQVRSNLDEAIAPYIRETIEQILEAKVEDLLIDATIETGRMAIVTVLADNPIARKIEATPKGKKLPKASAIPFS